jgi:small-conductance mechanosensitive channel
MKLLQSLKGKKTFVVAILMVALGLLQGDLSMILTGLGLAGLRDALPTQK